MRLRYEDCGVCRCCPFKDVCTMRKCDFIKKLLGELPWQKAKMKIKTYEQE